MIDAQGLSRRFGDVIAVEDASLCVPDGAILALLGPNGAGKTTTVRMLAGLLGPGAGEATVAGYSIRRDPAAVRARVGLVTDQPGLHEQMTMPAYLDFFGSLYGLPRALRARRIEELLLFFDLEAQRTERMAGFSKGMKQKVALARALLHEPAALFLDEPTSGLDPLSARSVRALIVELKTARRSIILCTHDLDEAERLADQVAILRRGRIVACDTPASLRARSSPDTVVRIELAAPCPPALDALCTVDGVLAPSLSPLEPGRETTLLEYRTVQPLAVNPRVMERLIGVGARVVSLTCATRTLEEVYADTMRDAERGPANTAERDGDQTDTVAARARRA